MALPPRPSISLAMIVRNSAERLPAALASVAEHVDEIVIVDTEPGGSQDGTRELAIASYGAKVYDFPWIDDFSAARNFSFEKCSHNLVLWIDDDDIVQNGHLLCDYARAAFSMGVTELYVDYDYAHDKHGNCRTRHKRERFLDKRVYEWRERVHETPCAKFLARTDYGDRTKGYIKHTSLIEEEARWNTRLARNLRIFQDMEKKGEITHRLFYLYANTLRSVGKLEDAIAWYNKYTGSMTRSSHLYAALVQKARTLLMMKQLDQARTVLGEAVLNYPNFASAYVYLAQTYGMVRDWDQAATWAREANLHIDGAQGELNFDPTELIVKPRYVLAESYRAQGEFTKAWEELKPAYELVPDSEEILELKTFCDRAVAVEKASDAYHLQHEMLVAEGNVDRLEALAEAAPDMIRMHPQVMKFKKRPTRISEKSIGIFCPIAYEPWGPKSDETGIGGSETAAIQVSRELAALGWDVTVYAWTKEKERIDGVAWNHYLAYNPDKDYHDVMVWWRDPKAPIQFGMNCKVSVFWAHDVLAESSWFMDPASIYDKVFVLSQYHRDMYAKRIPEDLLWVTRNGIDPGFLAEPDNKPGRVIYTSCPSRGLIHLMRKWTTVLDAKQDAELHIYYGWNRAYQNAMTQSPAHRRLYIEVENLKKQPGIFWHGRVGKRELYEAMAQAQVAAYPCTFPEISYIGGMEVQAMGCTPVMNGYAAVKETVQFGIVRDYELDKSKAEVQRYIGDLVDELKNPSFPSKEKMVSWARSTYPWSTAVREWDRLFSELLAVSGSAKRVLKSGEMPEVRTPAELSPTS